VQTPDVAMASSGAREGKNLKRAFNTAVRELAGGTLSEAARRARTPIAPRGQRPMGIDSQQRALSDAAAALAALWQTERKSTTMYRIEGTGWR
jgi:hypothetical protein